MFHPKTKIIALLSVIALSLFFGWRFSVNQSPPRSTAQAPASIRPPSALQPPAQPSSPPGTQLPPQAAPQPPAAPASAVIGSLVHFANDAAKQAFLQVNQLAETDLQAVPQLHQYRVAKTPDQLQNVTGSRVAANLRYTAQQVPNDPLYSSQYHLPKINAPNGWDITTGSSAVVIADLDTGFAVNHQDLSSKWAPGGYDFIDNTSDVSAGKVDPAGSGVSHGTMTASLLGAATNNSLGGAGVCWSCRILPVQVLDDEGTGDSASVASGIDYATNQGARVINMSLGSSFPDSTIQTAVNYALAHNVVVVAAAGNSGPTANSVIYPAAYPGVLAVGATDSTDTVASFSSRGSQLGVTAPGVSITSAAWSSTNQTSGYATGSGTSFAAPQVAGEAGLILSAHSSFSYSAVTTAIEDGADKVAGMSGQNFTNNYGFGRVNLANALSGGVSASSGNYSWQPVSQYAYTDSSKTTPVNLAQLSPGQTVFVGLTAKNTGTATWLNNGVNPIDLGTSQPTDRLSAFCATDWLGCNRPARLKEASVAPGQIGTFEFSYTARAGGVFLEHVSLVAEGLTWLNDPGVNYYTDVSSAYSWQLTSQYAYTDSSKTTPVNLTQLTPGQTVFVGLTARNSGTATWFNSGAAPLDLGTTHPTDRLSTFCAANWLGCNRPTRLKEASVAPGQVGTFEFSYTVPAGAHGQYLEYVNLVAEGITWLNDPGVNFYTNVP